MHFLNTNILLILILLLEYYGPEIEYIQGKKNLVADAQSIFTKNDNQNTTQESNYITEIMSEINDIDVLPEGIFPVNLEIIDQYQHKDPSLMYKYKNQ